MQLSSEKRLFGNRRLKMEQDKILHAAVCAAATLIIAICTSALGMIPSLLCGSLFSLGLGLGKEYGDSKATGNSWSWEDIIADLVGIVLACAILLTVYLLIHRGA